MSQRHRVLSERISLSSSACLTISSAFWYERDGRNNTLNLQKIINKLTSVDTVWEISLPSDTPEKQLLKGSAINSFSHYVICSFVGAELGQIGLVLVSGEKIHCHFPLATRQENEHNYAIVKTIKICQDLLKLLGIKKSTSCLLWCPIELQITDASFSTIDNVYEK